MKKTKIITISILTLFSLSLLFSNINVNATPSVESFYYWSNSSGNYDAVNGYYSAQGQTFNATFTGFLTSIQLGLYRVGSPIMTIGLRIEGTGNSLSGTPNGTIFATALTTVNAATLTTDTSNVVTFYFDGNYQLIANQKYAYVWYNSTYTFADSNNAVRAFVDAINPTAEGQDMNYYTGSWHAASGSDELYYVYADASGGPPSTISYSYTITPDVTYNFWTWGTSAVLTQGVSYSYVGTVLNNSVPYVSGNYSIYKTAVFNSNLGATITNASNALGNGTVTLNHTASYAGGIFLIDIFQDFVLNSSATYQGIRVNGTISGSSETFTSDLVLMATEPSYQFIGEITGDIFNHAVIAYFPTEITLRQDTPYRFDGFILLGGIYLNATGNFTLYSTGLSSLYNVATIGTYSLVNTGTIGNGTFSFTFGPRSAANTLFEGYRVQITTDSGIDANFTYNLGWYRIGGTSHTNPNPPYPSSTFAPFPSSPTDTTGISGTMTTIVSFIILFLIIGLPAVILGSVAGLPGLIMGAIFGLGIGVIAGYLPFWFIFLIGTGTVMTLLMWRRNKAEGQ